MYWAIAQFFAIKIPDVAQVLISASFKNPFAETVQHMSI